MFSFFFFICLFSILSCFIFSFARMNGVWLFWVWNVVLFVRMLIKLAMANYYYHIYCWKSPLFFLSLTTSTLRNWLFESSAFHISMVQLNRTFHILVLGIFFGPLPLLLLVLLLMLLVYKRQISARKHEIMYFMNVMYIVCVYSVHVLHRPGN